MKPKQQIWRYRPENWSVMTKEERHRLRLEDYLRTRALKARGLGDPFDLSSKPRSMLISSGPQAQLRPSKDFLPIISAGADANFWRALGVLPLLGEKRGGVMTDHVATVPGRRIIVEGSPGATVTTSQGITAYQKILDNVSSTVGDKKRPNPHHFRTQRLNYGGGFTHAGDSMFYVHISGTRAMEFGLSASYTDCKDVVYNKTLSKMYDKIRGEVDLSVDAFQARQAGVMLNQRFKQGRDVFMSKAPRALKSIGDIITKFKRSRPPDWGKLWLEWQYGWKPLARSIYGAAENMIESASGSSAGVRGLPVRESSSEVGDSYITSVTDGDGINRTAHVESVYQCRIVAFYALNTGGLNQVAGYTSLNPVSIAWELVPYSFVIDWFVNIGGYLRNMESGLLYGSDFVEGYKVERHKLSIKQTAAGGGNDFSCAASGNAETKEFDRSVLSSSPLPRAPSFNPKLGTSRLISAASLLGVQLQRIQRKR